MIVSLILSNQGPIYDPGSMVQFMCSAGGGFGPVTTTWTSTCTGDCFVLQQATQEMITKDVLHVVDSGNHSCTVVDDVGNTGYSTIEVHISHPMDRRYVNNNLINFRCADVFV